MLWKERVFKAIGGMGRSLNIDEKTKWKESTIMAKIYVELNLGDGLRDMMGIIGR